MVLSESMLIALVAGVVSLVVSMVTTYMTASFARRKFEREVGEKYRQKLYELRLQEYPAAFGITGRIVFEEALLCSKDELVAIMDELRTWWVGPAAPLLSRNAVEAYYVLKKQVARIANTDGEISKEQGSTLFQVNKQFRLALRQDLDVLYNTDQFHETLRRDSQ